MDIESIVAAASRTQQADDAGLGNCSRIWHVGFFFDGIHRNIDQDSPDQRLSNISRLFRAFPSIQQNTANNQIRQGGISLAEILFREVSREPSN